MPSGRFRSYPLLLKPDQVPSGANSSDRLLNARVVADLLHTFFTLGLAPQPEGASLTGTVTAAEIPAQ